MKVIRKLQHKLNIYLWFFKREKTHLDFLGAALTSLSARWRSELNPVISYVCMLDVLRQRNFSGNFLELGGGYSTIILPNILDMHKVTLTSVDLNPSKYDWILNSVSSRRDFLKTINSVQMPTVTLDEAFEGLEFLRLKLMQFNRDHLRNVLAEYINDDLKLVDIFCECIFSESGDDLKNLIMDHHAYADDLKFYKSTDYESGKGYCSRLVEQGYKPNAVFFDCGEVSSVGEWVVISDSISVGGFALLHDIYYPKSIKNFLVSTYIELSKDWEIIYKDRISTQGAIVAIKK